MFGNRLRELRTSNELTQEDVGKLLNLSKGNISKYENGQLEPSVDVLKILSEHFSVSTDYLLGRTDNPTPYDNTERVTTAVADDPELSEFWDELKNRESLQLMFKQVKSMSDSDIKKIMRIIKAIEDEEAGK